MACRYNMTQIPHLNIFILSLFFVHELLLLINVFSVFPTWPLLVFKNGWICWKAWWLEVNFERSERVGDDFRRIRPTEFGALIIVHSSKLITSTVHRWKRQYDDDDSAPVLIISMVLIKLLKTASNMKVPKKMQMMRMMHKLADDEVISPLQQASP